MHTPQPPIIDNPPDPRSPDPALQKLEAEKLQLEIVKLRYEKSPWRHPANYLGALSVLASLLTALAVLRDSRIGAELQQERLDKAVKQAADSRAAHAELEAKIGALQVERDALAEEAQATQIKILNARKNYDAVIRSMVATMTGSIGKHGVPRVSVPIRVQNLLTDAIIVRVGDNDRESLIISPLGEGVLVEPRVLDAPTIKVYLEASPNQAVAERKLRPFINNAVRLLAFDGTSLIEQPNPDSPALSFTELIELSRWAASRRSN